jgi:hypothetical protein
MINRHWKDESCCWRGQYVSRDGDMHDRLFDTLVGRRHHFRFSSADFTIRHGALRVWDLAAWLQRSH